MAKFFRLSADTYINIDAIRQVCPDAGKIRVIFCDGADTHISPEKWAALEEALPKCERPSPCVPAKKPSERPGFDELAGRSS